MRQGSRPGGRLPFWPLSGIGRQGSTLLEIGRGAAATDRSPCSTPKMRVLAVRPRPAPPNSPLGRVRRRSRAPPLVPLRSQKSRAHRPWWRGAGPEKPQPWSPVRRKFRRGRCRARRLARRNDRKFQQVAAGIEGDCASIAVISACCSVRPGSSSARAKARAISHEHLGCDIALLEAAPTVWGKLKWYNPGKRYGFVELSDGSGDAFLHASALAGIRIGSLQPGVTLEVRTAPAQRGLQVTEVISVDSSTAAPPRPARKNFRSPSDRQPSEARDSVNATGPDSIRQGRGNEGARFRRPCEVARLPPMAGSVGRTTWALAACGGSR